MTVVSKTMSDLVVPVTVLHKTPRGSASLIARWGSCNNAVVKFLILLFFPDGTNFYIPTVCGYDRPSTLPSFKHDRPYPPPLSIYLSFALEILFSVNFIIPWPVSPTIFNFTLSAVTKRLKKRKGKEKKEKVIDNHAKRWDNLSTLPSRWFCFVSTHAQLRHYFWSHLWRGNIYNIVDEEKRNNKEKRRPGV